MNCRPKGSTRLITKNMTEDFSLKALVLGTITMNANAETESC